MKYLIEAMGGSVRAYNENGLVIEMELPLTAQENMKKADHGRKSENNKSEAERN